MVRYTDHCSSKIANAFRSREPDIPPPVRGTGHRPPRYGDGYSGAGTNRSSRHNRSSSVVQTGKSSRQRNWCRCRWLILDKRSWWIQGHSALTCLPMPERAILELRSNPIRLVTCHDIFAGGTRRRSWPAIGTDFTRIVTVTYFPHSHSRCRLTAGFNSHEVAGSAASTWSRSPWLQQE